MKWPAWMRKEKELSAPSGGGAAPTMNPTESATPSRAPGLTPMKVPMGASPPGRGDSPAQNRARDRSLYKAILASLYDAILIVDEKGSVIGSNARAEAFLGYSESQLWGRPCVDFITGFNPLVLAKIREHVSTGRFTMLSAHCVRKDGSHFPAEIALSMIHYLNATDLLLSIRNMERRKRAREQRHFEQDACKYAQVALMICNREGLIEYVNPACMRLLHREKGEEVLGHSLGEFCESASAVEQILHAPSDQISWKGKVRLRAGREQTVECNISAGYIPPRKDGISGVILSMGPAAQHPMTMLAPGSGNISGR